MEEFLRISSIRVVTFYLTRKLKVLRKQNLTEKRRAVQVAMSPTKPPFFFCMHLRGRRTAKSIKEYYRMQCINLRLFVIRSGGSEWRN